MTGPAWFEDSLRGDHPPETFTPSLEALWSIGRGDWDGAHAIVAAREGDRDCDLVHAHLHRREGDLANAAYWYRRSGDAVPTVTLEAEWRAIVARLLEPAGPAS